MNYKANTFPAVKDSFSAEEEISIDERILCRLCLAYIAKKRDVIEVEGSAFHYKKNPAGLYFSIICFSDASGCNNLGDYISEYSWFSGYKWSIVICTGCSSHLGWHFIGKGSFYGLIADRITGI